MHVIGIILYALISLVKKPNKKRDYILMSIIEAPSQRQFSQLLENEIHNTGKFATHSVTDSY